MNSLKHLFKATVISCLLTLPLIIYAQNKSLDWINKNAHELYSDTNSTDHDLRFLSKIVKGKAIVGLGEASHGTQEFFFQKRRIIKYLVGQEQYRLVALEFPNTAIKSINNYIQTGEGDLMVMIRSMMLCNSDELYKLCLWLKSFNQSRPSKDKVKIIGFDDEAFWSNPLTRDENMADKFMSVYKQDKHKSILWSHNLHLAKDTNMAKYKAMGYFLKKRFGSEYYVIGFDTYAGSVNVLNNGLLESRGFVSEENTFSHLFSKAKFNAFFVDFHAPSNPLLNTKNFIANIYADWREPRQLPIVPGADFDGLIFIKTTSPSKGVQ